MALGIYVLLPDTKLYRACRYLKLKSEVGSMMQDLCIKVDARSHLRKMDKMIQKSER